MKKLLFTLMILTLYSCEGTILDYDENKEYIENKKNITYYMGTPFSGTIIRKETIIYRKSKTTYAFSRILILFLLCVRVIAALFL